jgi:mono/diheme cytochrome c family protein
MCLGIGAAAAAPFQSLVAPTFTDAQAKRGEATYRDKCTGCHGDDLANGEFGPPLKGLTFREHWGGKALEGPFTVMSSTMPPDNPGGLPPPTYADVLAFILSKNGVGPAAGELPADAQKLKSMVLPQ